MKIHVIPAYYPVTYWGGPIFSVYALNLTGTYSSIIPTLVLCRIFNKPLVWSPRVAIQDAHEWDGAKSRRLKRLWERFCNRLIRQGLWMKTECDWNVVAFAMQNIYQGLYDGA